jgi:hypothetical protein
MRKFKEMNREQMAIELTNILIDLKNQVHVANEEAVENFGGYPIIVRQMFVRGVLQTLEIIEFYEEQLERLQETLN